MVLKMKYNWHSDYYTKLFYYVFLGLNCLLVINPKIHKLTNSNTQNTLKQANTPKSGI